MSSLMKNCPKRPKNWDSPGLADPKPLGTGKRRPSANVSLAAEMSRNVWFPTIG